MPISYSYKFYNTYALQLETNTAERILPPYLEPDLFLQLFSPERRTLLSNIFWRTGFDKFHGQFIVDMTLPMNIAGYYNKDKSNPVIGINPMVLLLGSETDIAHVLVHEGIHAGVYTDGEEVPEEVITETITKQLMYELYGMVTFQSGYDHMVKEMQPYLGELSFQQLIELVENGSEQAFYSFLELIILEPLFGKGEMGFQDIGRELEKWWPTLLQLFPRMINEIDQRRVGPHEQATMSASEFDLDPLLDKAALMIIERGSLEQVIDQVFAQTEINSLQDGIEIMKQAGYTYLIDAQPLRVRRMILARLATRDLAMAA